MLGIYIKQHVTWKRKSFCVFLLLWHANYHTGGDENRDDMKCK